MKFSKRIQPFYNYLSKIKGHKKYLYSTFFIQLFFLDFMVHFNESREKACDLISSNSNCMILSTEIRNKRRLFIVVSQIYRIDLVLNFEALTFYCMVGAQGI